MLGPSLLLASANWRAVEAAEQSDIDDENVDVKVGRHGAPMARRAPPERYSPVPRALRSRACERRPRSPRQLQQFNVNFAPTSARLGRERWLYDATAYDAIPAFFSFCTP